MKHGTLLALAMLAAAATALADGLETEFLTPLDASRPGVYWTFPSALACPIPTTTIQCTTKHPLGRYQQF